MFDSYLLRFPIFIVFFTAYSSGLKAQELNAPLKLPPAISGSFGEIRIDHFHSGIDLRTNGKTGYRVYSSEKGYVSRIKISAIGFGKTLYIRHPNGLTTVYAHLNSFSNKIARYVEAAQYAQKSFEIELFPAKEEISVDKSEFIAYSGNSGSSGGPHLHYEVRNTASQFPLTPFKFLSYWKNADTTPPTIKSVYIYHIDSTDYLLDNIQKENAGLTKLGNKYKVRDTLLLDGTFGIGVKCSDFVNSQSNLGGFSTISCSVNNQLTYYLSVDSFSFSETKYVNSIIDYAAEIESKDEIVKLWADPNNKFSGLRVDSMRGIIKTQPNNIYSIDIAITDFFGNAVTLNLIVKGKIAQKEIRPKDDLTEKILLPFNKENNLKTKYFAISIPKDALYHDILFDYSIDSSNRLSPVIRVDSKKTPLQKKFELRIPIPVETVNYSNKIFIGYLNGKGLEYCDSKLMNNDIESQCAKFGVYTLGLDTIPPKIKPLNIRQEANLQGQSQINIELTDNTGINTYAGYIDNKWMLFEWDPKYNLLSHKLDKQRISANSWHTLTIEVTDKLNNKTKYTCKFFW